MYKLIATISVLIRQFYLPNPFEPLGSVFNVDLFGIAIPMTPDILNWCVEGVLHALAFGITGIYYNKGIDDPTKGSILYLFFYCVHTGLLYLMSMFGFTTWAVAIIIVLYIAAHIGINALKNKFVCGGI